MNYENLLLNNELLEYYNNEDMKKLGKDYQNKRGISVFCSDIGFMGQYVKMLAANSIQYDPKKEELIQISFPYAPKIFREDDKEFNWNKKIKNTSSYKKRGILLF
jgi:hypothetical protein